MPGRRLDAQGRPLAGRPLGRRYATIILDDNDIATIILDDIEEPVTLDTPMPTTATPQIDAFPRTRVIPQLQWVSLGVVEDVDAEPNADFTASIERLGILQPVALIATSRANEAPPRPFVVADGRRRIVAARRAGLSTVPAVIFPLGTSRAHAASITLSTNFQRRGNPISELEAIEELMALGLSRTDIAERLRLPIRTINSRLRLSNLIDGLRVELSTGLLTLHAALAAAQLGHEDQERILASLEQGHPWSARRVRETFLGPDQSQIEIDVEERPAPAGPVTPMTSIRGWRDIAAMLGQISDALPSTDGYEGADVFEIEEIGDRVAELLDLVSAFVEEPR